MTNDPSTLGHRAPLTGQCLIRRKPPNSQFPFGQCFLHSDSEALFESASVGNRPAITRARCANRIKHCQFPIPHSQKPRMLYLIPMKNAISLHQEGFWVILRLEFGMQGVRVPILTDRSGGENPRGFAKMLKLKPDMSFRLSESSKKRSGSGSNEGLSGGSPKSGSEPPAAGRFRRQPFPTRWEN